MDINKSVRGKNLLRNRTLEQLVKDVSAGNFSDIELGDYIVVNKEGHPLNGTVWIVGGINIVDRYPFNLISHDDENGTDNEDNSHNHILLVCKDILPLDWKGHYSSGDIAFNEYLYKVKEPVAATRISPVFALLSRNTDYNSNNVLTDNGIKHSSFIEKDSEEWVWHYMSDMPENFIFDSPRASSGWGESIKSIIGQLPLFRLDPSRLQALPFDSSGTENSYVLNTHIGKWGTSGVEAILYFSNTDGIGQGTNTSMLGIRPFVVFGNYSSQPPVPPPPPTEYKVYPVNCLAYQEDPLEIIISEGYHYSQSLRHIEVIDGKLNISAIDKDNATKFKVIEEDGLYFTLRPIINGQEKYISMAEDETSTEVNPIYCYTVVSERDEATEPKFNFRLCADYMVSKLDDKIHYLALLAESGDRIVTRSVSQGQGVRLFPECRDDTVIHEPDIEGMNAIVYMSTNTERIWKKAFKKDVVYDSRFVMYNEDKSGFIDVDNTFHLHLNRDSGAKKRIWYYCRYDPSGDETLAHCIYTFIDGKRFYLYSNATVSQISYAKPEFISHNVDGTISSIRQMGSENELWLDGNNTVQWSAWTDGSKPLSIIYYNEEVEFNEWDDQWTPGTIDDKIATYLEETGQDYVDVKIVSGLNGSGVIEERYLLCATDSSHISTKQPSEITGAEHIWRFKGSSSSLSIIRLFGGTMYYLTIEGTSGNYNLSMSSSSRNHIGDLSFADTNGRCALYRNAGTTKAYLSIRYADGRIKIGTSMPSNEHTYFIRPKNPWFIPGTIIPGEE